MEESGKTPRNWPWDIFVLGLFGVLSAIMTFPLVLRLGNTIENWGDPLLNAWILSWDVHQFFRDPLHLFDANIFHPYTNTLAFSESLLASALLVAPVNLLSGNAILAYNVLVFLSFVLSGFSAYLLGRELTGNRFAGLVGGFVFAFSLYRFGEFSHVQLLTAQWMPLALLYFIRFLRGASLRDGLLFALFFSLQALSSFYYAFYIAIACALYFVFVAIPWAARRVSPPVGIPRRSAIVVAVIALVVVPPTLPYFAVERDLGLYRTLEDTISGSASLENYLAVPANSLYSQLGAPFVSRTPTEETLFPGLLAIVLALLAVIGQRKNKNLLVGYFVTLLAVAFVLSLGPFLRLYIEGKPDFWLSLPYGFMYDYLPGFKSMRVPARFSILIVLGLAGLTTAGAYWLLTKVKVQRQPVVVGAICLLLGLEYFSAPMRTTPIDVGDEIPQVYRWLAAQTGDGAIFEYPTMESSFPPKVEEMERLGRYQYLSTYHWRPSITGYSGFIPPLFAALREEAKGFPNASSVSLLRGLGAEYVIFHTADIDPDRWTEIKRRLSAVEADFQQVASFGTDLVYVLSPGVAQGRVEVDVFLPSATGSDGNYQAYYRVLNLGDAAITYKAATRVAVKVEWAMGGKVVQQETVFAEMPPFLQKGLTVTPVSITPPPPGEYQLSLETANSEPKVTTSSPVVVTSSALQAQKAGQTQSREKLQMSAVSVAPGGYRPGSVLPVHIKWRAPEALLKNYTLFAKLVDGDNKFVAGVEAEPLQGHFLTSQWQTGSLVDDLYGISIPPGTPAGRYRIMVGAYNFSDGSEPQLLDPNGAAVERIIVGSVRVTGEDGHLSTDAGVGMQSVNGQLGDTIVLRGFKVNQPPRPGGVLDVTLYWEALKRMEIDYTGFVHVLDRNGQPVAQIDGQPAAGRFPTSIWEPGEFVPDQRQIKLPANLPVGVYQLKAGLYSLPGPTPLMVSSPRDKDDGNRVYLGEIEVR